MKTQKFIQTQVYNLPENSTINTPLLSTFVGQFWSDIFKPLTLKHKEVHLVLMCKVLYAGSTNGYKTLGDARRVNFEDLNLYVQYLSNKINVLNDSYTVLPCINIEFTYFINKTKADENRLLKQNMDYKVASHGFNNYNLPLSMNPEDYGVTIATQDLGGSAMRYVVKNDRLVFTIETSENGLTNNVRIEGLTDITWVDTKLNGDTFKREISKNVIYVSNGKVVAKEKELPAKPFSKLALDKKVANSDIFMTMGARGPLKQFFTQMSLNLT